MSTNRTLEGRVPRWLRGESSVAEHYVLLAELRAGLIDWDDYARLKPLGSPWVGITSGILAWAGDGSSATTQRDRVRCAFGARLVIEAGVRLGECAQRSRCPIQYDEHDGRAAGWVDL